MSGTIVIRKNSDGISEESPDVVSRSLMVLELGDVRSFIDILTKAANDQEHNAQVKDGITTTKLEIKVLGISMRVPQTSVIEAHDERKVALVDPDGGNAAESEESFVADYDVESEEGTTATEISGRELQPLPEGIELVFTAGEHKTGQQADAMDNMVQETNAIHNPKRSWADMDDTVPETSPPSSLSVKSSARMACHSPPMKVWSVPSPWQTSSHWHSSPLSSESPPSDSMSMWCAPCISRDPPGPPHFFCGKNFITNHSGGVCCAGSLLTIGMSTAESIGIRLPILLGTWREGNSRYKAAYPFWYKAAYPSGTSS